MPMAS